MREKIYYERRAREMLRELLRRRDVSYGELAARLKLHGAVLTRKALTNKLHRGTSSFAFALQVFAAFGEKSVPVTQLPVGPRPSSGTPPVETDL
jgi:hypothetical protein